MGGLVCETGKIKAWDLKIAQRFLFDRELGNRLRNIVEFDCILPRAGNGLIEETLNPLVGENLDLVLPNHLLTTIGG